MDINRFLNRFLRPRFLALVFGAYFVIIALAAAIFASGLKGVWYRADLSRWVYTGYLVTAAVFLSGTSVAAAIGVRRVGTGNPEAEAVEDRVEAEATRARGTEEPTSSSKTAAKDDVDQDIDELLVSLQEMETQTEEAEEAEEVEEPPVAVEAPKAEAASARAGKAAREIVSMYMLGPALASAVVLGISAALLPGVDVMLQSYHQLNTAVILGIAYSYGGLAAYTALSTFAMLRSG